MKPRNKLPWESAPQLVSSLDALEIGVLICLFDMNVLGCCILSCRDARPRSVTDASKMVLQREAIRMHLGGVARGAACRRGWNHRADRIQELPSVRPLG